MSIKKLSSLIVCVFAFMFTPVGFADSVRSNDIPLLTIFTEDWPPYQYLEGKELKGYSVEVLDAVLKKAGSSQRSQDFTMVPWARGIFHLNTRANTLLFLMTRTQERDPKYKWVGPLFHNISYIYAKKGTTLDIEKKDTLGNYGVAAINGDISERYLRDLGFPEKNIIKVNHSNSLIQMLNQDRVDAIVDNWSNFSSKVKSLSLDMDRFQIIGIANTDEVSYAFNIQTPDWVIMKLQIAFDELVSQGTVDAIRAKYHIVPEPKQFQDLGSNHWMD